MSAGQITQGRRLPDCEFGSGPAYNSLEIGDYFAVNRGPDIRELWFRDPAGHIGRAAENHTITEHDDGTITMSPSLLDPDGWHGWLERGVWREV